MKRLSRTSALAGFSNHSRNREDITIATARNEYWKAMLYSFSRVQISKSLFIFVGIVAWTEKMSHRLPTRVALLRREGCWYSACVRCTDPCNITNVDM